MALIILEGLDRTGKSSVAQHFQDQGFQLIHMSAPAKGTSSDEYLGEMVDLLSSLSGKDTVLDRSHYGELVWPSVYGREALLSEDDFQILREIEDTMDVTRVLMHDPNSETHWQRCVDNKEPLTKVQFIKARSLFSAMADKYGFARKTLKDFPDAVQPLPKTSEIAPQQDNVPTRSSVDDVAAKVESSKTREQLKLERANVINEVLSKRILKGKSSMHDELERSVRHFLNAELGKIFGNNPVNPSVPFSNEEVELLKFFVQRLKEKND